MRAPMRDPGRGRDREASGHRSPGIPKKSVVRDVDTESYWTLTTRPLHTLIFLTPMLLLYELGTLLYLSGQGMVEVIRARQIMSQVFDVFGAVGFHIPPLLLAVVLVCWHVLERDQWRVRKDVIVGMALESFLWTLPLVVFAAVVGASAPMMQLDPAASVGVLQHSIPAKITLALGAGVYEELLFRLVLIALIHFVAADVFKLPQSTSYIIAGICSALAFTFYHNVMLPSGGADLRLMATYAIAGGYFAVLFILRGFGIAVATHACYDIVALVLLTKHGSGG
jgi:hypothetical protein